MTVETEGISRPREAMSVAIKMRDFRERKEERLELRWDCGRRECRDVTGWERLRSVRCRMSAVVVRLVKMIMLGLLKFREGVVRRVCRKVSFWVSGTWR